MIRLAEWLVHLTYAALFGSLGAALLLLVRRFVTVRAGPRYSPSRRRLAARGDRRRGWA